jgi:hypothetical protein
MVGAGLGVALMLETPDRLVVRAFLNILNPAAAERASGRSLTSQGQTGETQV